jgi:hypothetical protein
VSHYRTGSHLYQKLNNIPGLCSLAFRLCFQAIINVANCDKDDVLPRWRVISRLYYLGARIPYSDIAESLTDCTYKMLVRSPDFNTASTQPIKKHDQGLQPLDGIERENIRGQLGFARLRGFSPRCKAFGAVSRPNVSEKDCLRLN